MHAQWLAPCIAAGVVTELCLVCVDALFRHDAREAAFWGGGLLLAAATGVALGLSAWLLHSLGTWTGVVLVGRTRGTAAALLARYWPRAWWSLCAVLAFGSSARWLFSGKHVARTWLAQAGPPLLLTTIAAAVWLGATLLARARGASPAAWRALSIAALLGAALFADIDLTVLVALYERLHTALEIAASSVLLVLSALWLGPRIPSNARRGCISQALAGLGMVAALTLALPGRRRQAFGALTPSLRDPEYIGRMLLRAETATTWLENPWLSSLGSIASLRVERLIEDYGIANVSLGRNWQEPAPTAQPPAVLPHPDVLIFYVDSLRLDIAENQRLMPAFGQLARESLDFRRAYAAGSDTGVSLPGIVNGRYGEERSADNFLHVAETSGYQTDLIIPRSAREYLKDRFADFRLEREEMIPDYAEGEKVWGYGGHIPTSSSIVDKAIEHLKAPHERPELLWLFNFDAHNWRELDDAKVAAMAQRFHVDPASPTWRYQAIAASVDAELGRLVQALRDGGRLDKTVLVFISDHGEALGERGFWEHSYYLWESLVRVPLLLRIPHVAPRVIDTAVSLVDLAPTLTSLISPGRPPDVGPGQSLFSAPGPRHDPILFSSTLHGTPARIGILSDDANTKLVLHLDAAMPALLDLTRPDPDGVNLAQTRPLQTSALLAELVRSPIFPREH
ncbi:MAG TPA: sulfatase-like hydrolase/transferase [Polyangiaceae bacterium]|nr:sulfatase-like hydrolase/transferase [Polyangiaceae bacterium]